VHSIKNFESGSGKNLPFTAAPAPYRASAGRVSRGGWASAARHRTAHPCLSRARIEIECGNVTFTAPVEHIHGFGAAAELHSPRQSRCFRPLPTLSHTVRAGAGLVCAIVPARHLRLRCLHQECFNRLHRSQAEPEKDEIEFQLQRLKASAELLDTRSGIRAELFESSQTSRTLSAARSCIRPRRRYSVHQAARASQPR